MRVFEGRRPTADPAAEAERAAEKERRQAAWEERCRRERARRQAEADIAAGEAQLRAKVAQIERDLTRRASERAAELRRQEQREHEARRQSAAVRERTAECEAVLTGRIRGLTEHAPAAGALFQSCGAAGLAHAVEATLSASLYPEGLAGARRAEFHPDTRSLCLDVELPGRQAIPEIAGFRYIPAGDEIRPLPRPRGDIRGRYAALLARVTLRVLAEAFDVTPAVLVDTVVLNGHVAEADPPIRPCLVSVLATRSAISRFALDEAGLDPLWCLRRLGAVLSANPYDLEPVPPLRAAAD